jgi:hypothetical protein
MPKKKPPAAPPAAPPTNRILIGVVMFYVAVLVTMVASNRYVFILKSLVVPIMLLAALLSGRFKRFVNEWAVYLGVVVFFDFCRGLAFALTTHFTLPMYLGYVVAWERWLCGGALAPVAAQHFRAGLADPVWLDRFFVLVYSSHFVFFLLFGLVIWYARHEAFRTYAIAISVVMYGGLIFYFATPTIPPWAAAQEFLVIPPIVQIVRSFYNVHLPSVAAAFAVNPIAAMPSLHAAIPTMCALLALRYFGRGSLLVVAYTVTVWVAVIYLGEHYLIDVIAGVLLALVVYAGVHRWGAAPRSSAQAPAVREPHDQWEAQPIAIALLLVAAAFGFGQLSARWMGPLPTTRAFIERELMGRSVVAHYLLGRVAFDESDFVRAKTELALSLEDLKHPDQQKVIRKYLAMSAYQTNDLPAAITALEPLRQTTDDVDNLVLLANAYVESDQYQKGLAVLRDARSRFSGEPAPLYWLTRYQYLQGAVDDAYVQHTIDTLKQLPAENAGTFPILLTQALQAKHASTTR